MEELAENTMSQMATGHRAPVSITTPDLGPIHCLITSFMIYKLVSNCLQTKAENGSHMHKQSQSEFARILGRL